MSPARDPGFVDAVLDWRWTWFFGAAGVGRGISSGRVGFSGETSFKCSSFGVNAYVPLEGDEVKVLIEVEFVRSLPAGPKS
jgi:hypothetical protein